MNGKQPVRITPDIMRKYLQTPIEVEDTELAIAINSGNFDFVNGETEEQIKAMGVLKEFGGGHPRLANVEIALFGRRLTNLDAIKQ